MCTDTYCRFAGDFQIYIKEIISNYNNNFFIKTQISAFCKLDFAKCTFFVFFFKKIWWFQKKVVSLQ